MARITILVPLLGGAGLVFVWSGLHGANVTGSLKDLLAGRALATPTDTLGDAPAATETLTPAVQEQFGAATSPGVGVGFPHSTAGNRANGQLQAAGYGWTGAEWTALDKLWTRESGWNNTAQNPTSTAYGIAQFLDATWAGYGPKTSDPTLQIQYGLAYIRRRYGDPVAAWAHETAIGWY